MKQALHRFVTEFKQFAMRGSVVDLAVGVIIGGAFGKITTAVVNDLVTPLLGLILGQISLGGFQLGPFLLGDLVQVVIDFLITALIIFLIVKLMNRFRRREAASSAATPPAALSKEAELLTEIRDLLKGKKA